MNAVKNLFPAPGCRAPGTWLWYSFGVRIPHFTWDDSTEDGIGCRCRGGQSLPLLSSAFRFPLSSFLLSAYFLLFIVSFSISNIYLADSGLNISISFFLKPCLTFSFVALLSFANSLQDNFFLL